MRHQGIEAKSDSLRPVVMLVLGVLLARVVYLAWICGYDLVEDEAQYWLWAQHLDWSYYSKGPGVAWAIRLSTNLLGNAEWAVRLPTAVMSAAGALAAGALGRDVAARAWARADAPTRAGWATPARVGLGAALAYTLVPALQAAGILMTIDGPYIACWSVACWGAWRAMMGGGRGGWWMLVGLAVAIGFLFKYTMLLLVPGLLVFAMLRRREIVWSKWMVVGAVIALAGLVPVIVWNTKYDWPTWKHLLGHLGMRGGDMPAAGGAPEDKWSPWWLPTLIGQQLAIAGPWLVMAVWGGWERVLAGKGLGAAEDPRRVGRLFLLWAATPILAFYIVVSLIAEPEGNWPMAAYATLMPLAAWIGADALAARAAAQARGERASGPVRRTVWQWRAGLWYAAVAAAAIHFVDRIGDAALALDRQAWFHDRFHKALGRDPTDPTVKMRDPAGRVRGAREMAAHVAELMRVLLSMDGKEPFVVAQHYGRASQLSYYLRVEPSPGNAPGAPEVLCAMSQTGGRKSQFDIWEHTRLDRPEVMGRLLGRPAVIVSSVRPETVAVWERMFERVEAIPGRKLDGETKPDRSALLGHGYKGLGGTP